MYVSLFIQRRHEQDEKKKTKLPIVLDSNKYDISYIYSPHNTLKNRFIGDIRYKYKVV